MVDSKSKGDLDVRMKKNLAHILVYCVPILLEPRSLLLGLQFRDTYSAGAIVPCFLLATSRSVLLSGSTTFSIASTLQQ